MLTYIHFLSFLSTIMLQATEILPGMRQGTVYPTWSIPWLLMTWRREEPGHQQPWYWLNHTRIFNSSRVKLTYDLMWNHPYEVICLIQGSRAWLSNHILHNSTTCLYMYMSHIAHFGTHLHTISLAHQSVAWITETIWPWTKMAETLRTKTTYKSI